MNADSSMPDPYVQEFTLGNFSNVVIKPENSVGDGSHNDDATSTTALTPSSASTIVGLPDDDLLHHATPDSVIMSRSQIPRLPSMSLLHPTSPPPHLLTPPDSQEDYYSSIHHHPMMTSSLMKNCNLILPGNLPDTPPISSPPLPAMYHHLEHHHLQPQYPPLPTLHYPGEVAEEMLWLHQSTNLVPRQEPLDLRPHCTGDSVQNWNMLQQQTSVITAPGKRILHADFYHQASISQYTSAAQLPASSLIPASSPSSSSSSSLTAKPLVHNGLESQRSIDGRTSTGSRNCSRGRARTGAAGKMQMGVNGVGKDRPQNPEVKIEDDVLMKISVRDLNVKLKGTSKDQMAKTKQRRRTLKNRVYAQNCRNKRNDQKTNLEHTKNRLEQELKSERDTVSRLTKELNKTQNDLVREKQIAHSLRNEVANLLNELEHFRQRYRENGINRCSSASIATNLSVTSSVGDY